MLSLYSGTVHKRGGYGLNERLAENLINGSGGSGERAGFCWKARTSTKICLGSKIILGPNLDYLKGLRPMPPPNFYKKSDFKRNRVFNPRAGFEGPGPPKMGPGTPGIDLESIFFVFIKIFKNLGFFFSILDRSPGSLGPFWGPWALPGAQKLKTRFC